jgi:adenylate cyclase
MAEIIPKLVVTAPNGEKMNFDCQTFPILIGRATTSSIVISDERASRSHAQIDERDDKYYVTDLNSRNGTLFNGVDLGRSGAHELHDGDEIRIGAYSIVFSLPAKQVQVDYDDKPITGTVMLQNAADLLKPLSLRGSGDDLSKLSSAGMPAVRLDGNNALPPAIVSELETLNKRSRILGFFYDLNKLLAREYDVEKIYSTVAEQIFKVTNAGRVMFAKLDEDDLPAIEWGRYRDDASKMAYAGIPVSRTVIRKAVREQVSILCVDAMSDVNLKNQATFRLGSIRSLMCVPMLGQEESVLGAIYVDRTEVFGFSDDDLNFLTVVASNVALTLENILAHEKLLHDAEARAAYRRFLPQHVVDQIMADPDSLQLGGINQVVTIMFADIRGFTTLSERKQPQEIVELLNTYFERAAQAIFNHQGSLDKFIGDGIMALFGAPKPSERDPINAVQAAIALQGVVKSVNAELAEQGIEPISVGIGINTGEVTAGYIGSKLRTDYTVIGDNVNLAARLESNAKPGQILLGEQTYLAIQTLLEKEEARLPEEKEFAIVPMGDLKVKGKLEAVQVYQVMWDSPEESQTQIGVLKESGAAVAVYTDSKPLPGLTPGETVSQTQIKWESVRREPRRPFAVKVTVAGVDVKGESFEEEAVTEDISASGACLRLQRSMAVPALLAVKAVNGKWSVDATVRSVARAHRGYVTGVEFVGGGPDWDSAR